jgi:hypothetical protein
MGVPEHVAVLAAFKVSGLVKVCLIVEVALKCPRVRCVLIFARFVTARFVAACCPCETPR